VLQFFGGAVHGRSHFSLNWEGSDPKIAEKSPPLIKEGFVWVTV